MRDVCATGNRLLDVRYRPTSVSLPTSHRTLTSIPFQALLLVSSSNLSQKWPFSIINSVEIAASPYRDIALHRAAFLRVVLYTEDLGMRKDHTHTGSSPTPCKFRHVREKKQRTPQCEQNNTLERRHTADVWVLCILPPPKSPQALENETKSPLFRLYSHRQRHDYTRIVNGSEYYKALPCTRLLPQHRIVLATLARKHVHCYGSNGYDHHHNTSLLSARLSF